MATTVPVALIAKEIEQLLRFPNALVCRHWVAAGLLSLLETVGVPVSGELAGAVVGADDERALALLRPLLEERT